MPTHPRRRSRQVTFRVPPLVQDELKCLARSSDRPLAQLVRYSIDFLSSSGDDRLPTEEEECLPDGHGGHIGVRLSDEQTAYVVRLAGQWGVTPSAVLRIAVTRWLRSSAAAQLGAPPHHTSGGR